MLNNDIIDRIKLPFRKDKELFSSLRDIIGFYPRRIDYYKLALMHKSVSRRNAKGKPLNNERLEFLGDAILDAVVGDIVYRHFEGKREGFLTNTRSKLVQRETLNKLADEMGLCQLILSSGHSNSHNSYMGGNAFEALVGAIYLDRGYDACMRFMQKRILSQIINIDKVAYKEVNFKSKLIEWTQKNRVQMDFRLLEQKKDENSSPVFSYQVLIEGIDAGSGQGYSKKESQQIASKVALQRLRREPQFIDAVFAAKADRTKMEEEPVTNVPDTGGNTGFIIAAGAGDAGAPAGNDRNAGAAVADTPDAEAAGRRGGRRKDERKTAAKSPASDGRHAAEEEKKAGGAEETDEFDLSDITANPQDPSKEEIIAAAEAAAYN